MNAADANSIRVREIVEHCLNSMLRAGDRHPREDEGWIESGAVDSMGYVELLLRIETAMGVSGLFTRNAGALPCTTREAIEVALASNGRRPLGENIPERK